MLDVHPPHEPVHGWRDFLLHLFTITIGLFIALSLEGCVEWQHHRHLVHEAEAGLRTEIQQNAKGVKEALDDLHKQQATLKGDVQVMHYIVSNHKLPEHGSIDVTFHIHPFQAVSWKTAQSTGALAYMPYARTQEFADIYSTQDDLELAQRQAARDAILSLGPFMNMTDKGPELSAEEARSVASRIETLQGQLLLVDSLLKNLDQQYTKFLSSHAGE